MTARSSPYLYLCTLNRHWMLVTELVKREFHTRYRGSVLGVFWSMAIPLLMLAMYSFVFGTIFRTRWDAAESPTQFALILFAGLTVHGLFAETVTRAPTLILNYTSYVKRVVFPLEILPFITVGTAFLNFLISFAILLAAHAVTGGLPATVIYLPVVLAPYLLVILGLVLGIGAVGVYWRDLSHIVGVAISLAMFLAPIFYPLSAVPEPFRTAMYLNPLTFPVEQVRAVALFGRAPDFAGLALYAAASILVAWLGLAVFQKMRRGFADVL